MKIRHGYLFICILLIWFQTGQTAGNECREKVADVVFVLDSSNSIWPEDFVKQLMFVSNLVNSFTLGENNIRVGMATFGSHVRLDFHLKKYSGKQKLRAAIHEISYLGGGTKTADAIRFVREEMFKEANGCRPWAAHILVLITDGLSHNTTATIMEATHAQSDGIEMFVIGIGGGPELFDELSKIASHPIKEHVYKVTSYEALDSIRSSFEKKACDRPLGDQDTKNKPKPDENKPTVKCGGKPADVYFVLDASSSIWYYDFLKQLEFVKQLIGIFDLGPSKTRVGIVTFSDKVYPAIPLDRSYNKGQLYQAIDGISYTTGGTNTGGALQYLTERGFARGVARPDVAHVAIVMTDGQSSNVTKTQIEARKAHRKGIYLFSIGIGQNTDIYEMMDIASDPNEDFVFQVSDYDALESIKELLAIKTCGVDVPPTSVPKDEPSKCPLKKATDVMFLFDSTSLGRRHTESVENVIATLVDYMGVSYDKIRAGILQDNCPESGDIGLSQYFDPASFRREMKNFKYQGLQALLRRLRRYSFKPAYGGRSGAEKVAVIFVDGKLHNSRETILEASRAKFQNVRIYIVAMGHHYDISELRNMCSSPSSKHITEVPSYSDLKTKADAILAQICTAH